ncbi:MAG: hypothetical protein ABI146_04425 [Nitrobacter sp.]|jgi:hypothetical protein
MTESSALPPNEERAMCSTCDDLRREIALNRGRSIGLTDPTTIGINNAELKTLEEKLNVVVDGHFAAARPSSQINIIKEPTMH